MQYVTYFSIFIYLVIFTNKIYLFSSIYTVNYKLISVITHARLLIVL